MKPADRGRLTAALREHVGRIAADLRAKMLAPGDTRARAQQLHADEQVGEDFDVWTDLLSRRAAVLWVLKSVYVRVLEDRGLLSPGRLLDPEAQQLFERLAPHLGETAFLRWIYRDLASAQGGLPELFSPQPAEIAIPSDELSRALIQFWRHRDADTGRHWSFAEERFEGELMGDLYQELDPVVKARFALCQTPDFVRAFILDRTLTPAMETFGADQVRLLDPSCGSGHLLIDGLKRIVPLTAAQHPDWDRATVVSHVLNRVVGVDLNDYACALARARLIMTAAEMAGLTTLADAARFHPHVYWADGLEQVERDEVRRPLQSSMIEAAEEKPRATLTRSDVRDALKKVYETKFHAVVANPPYITEKDAARKGYHRELIGRSRRYVSATGKYSLGSPFTERCFQLAEKDGYVGIITGNGFMKREFGKSLIEKVLALLDLTLVVDTSQAYIPFHGTPTVLLFGRKRRPVGARVRAVMGKRGESGTPLDPAKGLVWSSIEAGWNSVGFEDEYVSVAGLPRETLGRHPWSLGGGGASELKEQLDRAPRQRLGELVDQIGVVAVTLQDDVYVPGDACLGRAGVPIRHRRPMALGDGVRDWMPVVGIGAVFPYDDRLEPTACERTKRFLWPWRAHIRANLLFGQTKEERGINWWEYGMLTTPKLRTPFSIAFAEVATHNHFVLDRGGKVFKQTAPVIKLPARATEDDHLLLLGLLNSSTACFWMKQVSHNKRGSGDGKGMRESWMDRFQFDSTKLQQFPVAGQSGAAGYSRALDAIAQRRTAKSLRQAIDRCLAEGGRDVAGRLQTALGLWLEADWKDFRTMVALQEELDWSVYRDYGLFTGEVLAPGQVGQLVPGQRPFEIAFAAANQMEAESDPGLRTDWFSLQGWEPPASNWPEMLGVGQDLYQRRLAVLQEHPALRLIEAPDFKRRWYKPDYDAQEKEALELWLADRVESAVKARNRAFTLDQVVVALQDDASVLAVCEVLTERPDFNLSQLVAETLLGDAVPSHRFHVYKPSGLTKRAVWERTWEDQRREDAGEKVTPAVPPAYAKEDFLRPGSWHLRGKLDVPKERFIAFTGVPGRSGPDTLYGWAGWTPLQRLRAILGVDEELDDAGVSLADRIGLLDSAWRLLPDAAREDSAATGRLKAELQALVGPEGPSPELIEDWRKRFPPPSAKMSKAKRAKAKREEADAENEESDE